MVLQLYKRCEYGHSWGEKTSILKKGPWKPYHMSRFPLQAVSGEHPKKDTWEPTNIIYDS